MAAPPAGSPKSWSEACEPKQRRDRGAARSLVAVPTRAVGGDALLDEAERSATCIGKARGRCSRHGIAGEIIVADNGARTDRRDRRSVWAPAWSRSRARAYVGRADGGIRAARGRFVIMADADDSYDFTDLMPFVTKLREGYQLVMATAFEADPAGRDAALHRYSKPGANGRGAALLRQPPAATSTAGCGGFHRDAVLAMGPPDHRHGVPPRRWS